MTNLKLLNVGCGQRFHAEWTNIDLVSPSAAVRQCDLRKGLPYRDHEFDGVYHSHVLEHLTPDEARAILRECYRVLKPGGVLRVVVPNLEDIAKEYLAAIARIDNRAEQSEDVLANQKDDHSWMILELIDQLTRQKSGGIMGVRMRGDNICNRDFLVCRLGQEFSHSSKNHREQRPRKSLAIHLTRAVARLRNTFALIAVTYIAGTRANAAFREGLFRQSGEIHRWMYDRISLAALLIELQFESPLVVTASESRIDSFDRYQLDRDGHEVRKPDSLFMEATKPSGAVNQSKSHRAA